MSGINWLSRETVEHLHDISIEMFGGSHGLRDPKLLESALARPQNHHAYGENDVFQLAASYAESIAQNHAFVDGNKRAALASAGMFLKDNGFDLQQSTEFQHGDMMVDLAQGKITREKAGQYFKEHSRPRNRE